MAGSSLFLSEDLSDVCLEVGEWRMPTHRLVLSAQSEVFRRMLATDCVEKDSGCVHITDIKPRVMSLLLGYMYRGNVTLENWHDALELLRAAHKYQVEPLVQHCAWYLEGVLRLENVCAVLEAACVYQQQDLRDRCVALAAGAGFAMLRSRGFRALKQEHINAVMAHPDLLVDGELARSMSDAEKSELRARTGPRCLRHARRFTFDLCGGEGVAAGILTRFTLSSPLFLIGLRMRLLSPQAMPPALHLALSCGIGSVGPNWGANIAAAPRREGPPGVFNFRLILAAPLRLQAGTAYRLALTDAPQGVLCPQTRLRSRTMRTRTGIVYLSLHAEHCLAITSLIFIC